MYPTFAIRYPLDSKVSDQRHMKSFNIARSNFLEKKIASTFYISYLRALLERSIKVMHLKLSLIQEKHLRDDID